jgi:release factor glutamine methyltransferase
VNINNWLQESTTALKNAGIESARLDCLILLEKVLEINKTLLLANLEQNIKNDEIKLLNKYLGKRLQHLPIAYITNYIEFYGREFFVDKRVLIPRPETEQIIDHLLEIRPQPSLIYDIGTGSGVLAITAKKHLPASRVYAIDNSKDALSVARINSKKHQTDINFEYGDLLSGIDFSNTKKPNNY